MQDVSAGLSGIGLELPAPPAAAGAYEPVSEAGGLLLVSGQVPVRDGALAHAGRVDDSRMDEALESARLCALNVLAQLGAATPGRRVKISRITVYVSSDPSFTRQHEVANAASEVVRAALGGDGRHSRAAIGVAALPLGAMTEVEAVAHG
ncbi:MAG: RidA family protein [Nitrosopumilus sp.]|nr:RidA family protein [Nitrosopumilus sp.]CAI9832506.1 Translation initiation inhibitor [Nitrosopumilaceae archaeon]MDA7941502.1 RidA family protein [Nitrosopumilus sp.]MDA7943356.1 RidA family protein [Nitrosopumilus sp.]MDA7944805.1 RidA family protein [Nitrosopumilus sp.]